MYGAPTSDCFFREYPNWVKDSVKNDPTAFNFKDNQNDDRKYLSYVYFDFEEAKVFNLNKTRKMKFTQQTGSYEEVGSIGRINFLRHRKISPKWGKVFDVVILPYDMSYGYCTQRLVYLIPRSHKYNLRRLWEDFYTEGNFKQFFVQCPHKIMGLFIPKMSRLVSEVNLIDIMPQCSSITNYSAVMKTFVEVKQEDKQSPEINEYIFIPTL